MQPRTHLRPCHRARKRSSCGWRYRASVGRQPAAWSPNLESTWTNFRLLPTWPVGRRCVPAITKARKRLSGKTRKGNVWLRRTMCEVAWAASHTKDTYFAAQFRRIASRRGNKRALMAVAHSILVTAYHMLKHKRHYQELGADFFDAINRDKVRDRLVQRLAKLGFDVTLKSKDSIASDSQKN